jgi:hypothetical protein
MTLQIPYCRGLETAELHLRCVQIQKNCAYEHWQLNDFCVQILGGSYAEDVSRLALRPTQPPVQWVPRGGGPFPGAKRGRSVALTTHPI